MPTGPAFGRPDDIEPGISRFSDVQLHIVVRRVATPRNDGNRQSSDQNFTCGAASTSVRLAPRSKKSLRVKPNIPANRAAGICWMPVLYSWTALLKKRRLAAILFSRSDNSLANCWKLALALRSG